MMKSYPRVLLSSAPKKGEGEEEEEKKEKLKTHIQFLLSLSPEWFSDPALNFRREQKLLKTGETESEKRI